MTGTAPATHLDPVLLARIGDLALLARMVVDGFMHGMHRSRRVGLSLDFAEHRAYQPGDDIRAIDWNVTARFNHPYIKVFEEEREMTVMLVVDLSASQRFGTQGGSKVRLATPMPTEAHALPTATSQRNMLAPSSRCSDFT